MTCGLPGQFFGWMSQGDHSEPVLLLALLYQITPSCLKVIGWWGGGVGWGGGGPCDFSVSPSPFDLDFGTLDFGTSDSGLTICIKQKVIIYFIVTVNLRTFVPYTA